METGITSPSRGRISSLPTTGSSGLAGEGPLVPLWDTSLPAEGATWTRAQWREQLLALSEAWGLSLLFVSTEDMEASERVLADSLVGFWASRQHILEGPPEKTISSFARLLYARAVSQARSQGRRGLASVGAGPWFRLAVEDRILIALKVWGGFSRKTLKEITGRSLEEIELSLERARWSFHKGASWAQETQWCFADPLERTLSLYVDGDLDQAKLYGLQSHFIQCEPCRKHLIRYKEIHQDWVQSLPRVPMSPELRESLSRVLLGVDRVAEDREQPSLWTGWKAHTLRALEAMVRDPWLQVAFLALIAFWSFRETWRALALF